MSKFKLKDRIVCTSNGNLATIVGVDTSPMSMHVEYTILWDHLPHKTYTYFEHEILSEWGLYNSKSPVSIGYDHQGFVSSVDYLSINEPQSCNHNMKDYIGFKESYKFCTKCDHKEYRND